MNVVPKKSTVQSARILALLRESEHPAPLPSYSRPPRPVQPLLFTEMRA